MKKIIVAIAAGLVCFGATQVLAEDDSKFSLDAEVGFLSDYMFRGVNLYDGTSIQPSVTAGYDLGILLGHSLLTYGIKVQLKVIIRMKSLMKDYTLAYALPIDIVTLSGGLIWYTYSHDHVGNVDTLRIFCFSSSRYCS